MSAASQTNIMYEDDISDDNDKDKDTHKDKNEDKDEDHSKDKMLKRPITCYIF